jgi:hypothetical protein
MKSEIRDTGTGGLPVAFDFAPNGAAWSLHRKGRPEFGWKGLSGSVEVNGRLVMLSDAKAAPVCTSKAGKHSIVFDFPDAGFRWRWELSACATGLEVSARLTNTGSVPLTLGAWNVLHLTRVAGGVIGLGNGARTTFFGWRSWSMRVERLGSGDGRHVSEVLCHLHDQDSGTTLLSAFTTMDRMAGRHTVICANNGRIDEYRATCLFGEYVLQPGQELESEKLRLGIYADPYAALEAWAEDIRRVAKPRFAALPPVGWIGFSWGDAFDSRQGNYEQLALANARAIREKLPGFDVDYFWISQMNLKDAIPGNWLKSEPRFIPSGLPKFFGKLKKLGYLPGLWIAPYWFYSQAEGMLEENCQNLLRGADGKPICHTGPFGWMYDDDLPWYKLHKYYLDGTHPKSLAFLRKVFGYYRKIGVRYYMLDFLDIISGAHLHDPSKTPLQVGCDMLRVVRESAGPDTHLQTAVASTPAYAGVINAARVGRDFGEGRPLQGTPLSDWRNATSVLHDEHYANTRHLLQNVAGSYFTHRKLYMNDFNVLTIDKPMPLEHARIAVTVFGLGGGSPIMLGDDYTRMDPERLRMVKLCLPRTPGMFKPADLFERVHPDDYCRVLKLEVKTGWDHYLLAAVFNLDDKPYDCELDFAKLGLDAAAAHRVFEFWNGEYAGTFKRRFACTIPAGTCRLYRIAKARPYPWLLGTDLHAQQGAVDVKALKWDATRMRLSGTVSRPAGESGNLFLLMPRNMRLVNHEGTGLLKELLDFNVIVRVPVEFRKDTAKLDLRFEPWVLTPLAPRGLLYYSTEKEWREHMKRNSQPGDTRVYE